MTIKKSNKEVIKPSFKIDVQNWEIPLRYYKGWTIEFHVRTENFACPILCLFNFSNVGDLEEAIDRSIKYRESGN